MQFTAAKWVTGKHLCPLCITSVLLKPTRKTELAFNSLSKRIANGESDEEAANHTGIELTQAAEVYFE